MPVVLLFAEESWEPKIWCYWTVVLEKTLESPFDCKQIQPTHPKGNQSWIFIGRTDAAETPILLPPDAKNWLIGKDPDAGKNWRQEEKGLIEDEMVGWYHPHNGHEFDLAMGVSERQAGLVCSSSWGHKESDILSNWNELNWTDTTNGACIHGIDRKIIWQNANFSWYFVKIRLWHVEKFKIYEIIVVFLPYIPSLHPNLAKYGISLSPENRSFPQISLQPVSKVSSLSMFLFFFYLCLLWQCQIFSFF